MKELILALIYLYKTISAAFRETRIPFFIYTDCKFHPSCSDFAAEAISKYGVTKGSAKSLLRIIKCSPLSKGGIDLP